MAPTPRSSSTSAAAAIASTSASTSSSGRSDDALPLYTGQKVQRFQVQLRITRTRRLCASLGGRMGPCSNDGVAALTAARRSRGGRREAAWSPLLEGRGVGAFPSMIPEGGMQLRRCHLIASRLEYAHGRAQPHDRPGRRTLAGPRVTLARRSRGFLDAHRHAPLGAQAHPPCHGRLCRNELGSRPGRPPQLLHPHRRVLALSLIHISEPTRRTPISYAVF